MAKNRYQLNNIFKDMTSHFPYISYSLNDSYRCDASIISDMLIIRKIPRAKLVPRKGDIAQLWNHRHFPLIHKGNPDPLKLCHWHLREVTYLVNVQTYRVSLVEKSRSIFRVVGKRTVKKWIVMNVCYGNTLKTLILAFIVPWRLFYLTRSRRTRARRVTRCIGEMHVLPTHTTDLLYNPSENGTQIR